MKTSIVLFLCGFSYATIDAASQFRCEDPLHGNNSISTSYTCKKETTLANQPVDTQCVCDSLCQDLDDCCVQSIRKKVARDTDEYQCVKLRGYGDFYMKSKCSTKWRKRSLSDEHALYVQERCENSVLNSLTSDPFGTTPVNGLSGTKYLNYYCAACNNDSSTNITFWQRCLKCPTLQSVKLGGIALYNFTNLRKVHSTTSNLIYNATQGFWGVLSKSNSTYREVFHRCFLYPIVPTPITTFLETCTRLNGYTSPSNNCIEGHLGNQEIIPFCTSTGTNSLGRIPHNLLDTLPIASFTYLFKTNQINDDVICKEEELYDPYTKKCRNIRCGHENLIHESGECMLKVNTHMEKFSFICLCLSNFCLFLHIFATLLVKGWHNANVINVCSLCIALFGGFVLFTVSPFLVNKPVNPHNVSTACYTLALSMYFFFTSSFIWMLIIAVDVYVTLKQTIESLRCDVKQYYVKKICKNLTFGWLIPLSMTMLVGFANYGSYIPEVYQPKLGFNENGFCWFNSNIGILIYFITPFALIMGLNLLFFTLSVRIIYVTTSNNTSITHSKSRTNFCLYLRLAIIVGLSWSFGLLAIGIESKWLWCTFIGLNGLQGLFIFWMFTCTNKVLLGLKLRWESIRYSFHDVFFFLSRRASKRNNEATHVKRKDSTASTVSMIKTK